MLFRILVQCKFIAFLCFHLAMRRGQLFSDTKYLLCGSNLNCQSKTMLLFILRKTTWLLASILCNFELIFYASHVDSFYFLEKRSQELHQSSWSWYKVECGLLLFSFTCLFLELVHEITNLIKNANRFSLNTWFLSARRISRGRNFCGECPDMCSSWGLYATPWPDQDLERFCSQGGSERAYGEFHLYITRQTLCRDEIEDAVGISSRSVICFEFFSRNQNLLRAFMMHDQVNVVKGLKLYEDILTDSELLRLAELINELRLAGRRGELSGQFIFSIAFAHHILLLRISW